MSIPYKMGAKSDFSATLLDALNDGFTFDASGGGCVLMVLGADIAWQEDARWTLGLLCIVQARSREHLAVGERFFALLVLPIDSPLIGAVVEQARVPAAFWSPHFDEHTFQV